VLETVRELCRAHASRRSTSATTSPSVAELADRVAVSTAAGSWRAGPASDLHRAGGTRTRAGCCWRCPTSPASGRSSASPATPPCPQPSRRLLVPPALPARTDECRSEFPPVTDLGAAQTVRCHHHGDVATVPRRPPGRDRLQTERGRRLARSAASTPPRRRAHAVRDRRRGHGATSASRWSGSPASGKTRSRAASPGCDSDYTGEVALDGQPLRPRRGSAPARRTGDPVRVPEPVRVAQPAAHGGAGDRRASYSCSAAAARPWRSARARRALPRGRRPYPDQLSAASVSASRSPGRWRRSRRCSCATRSQRDRRLGAGGDVELLGGCAPRWG